MGRRHTVEVDHGRPLAAQPQVGHNRWHPGIEPILSIDPGDSVVLQTLDAMDGQLTPASTAADVAAASLDPVHPPARAWRPKASAPLPLSTVTG